MTIEGRIHKIYEEEYKTDKFRVRNFVVRTDDRYSPYITFQLTNKYCDKIEEGGIVEGDKVTINFEIGGKSYFDKKTGEEKYFNTLTATSIIIRT